MLIKVTDHLIKEPCTVKILIFRGYLILVILAIKAPGHKSANISFNTLTNVQFCREKESLMSHFHKTANI